jgi:VWFA-related protein
MQLGFLIHERHQNTRKWRDVVGERQDAPEVKRYNPRHFHDRRRGSDRAGLALRAISSASFAGFLLLIAASLRGQVQDPPRFTERVDVARILIDVRAIDPRGRPLLGLEAPDFEVKIGGEAARVESVQRITGVAGVNPVGSPNPAFQRPADPRLVVFLFQKSLERSRIPGLMMMLQELRRSVGTFAPADRVAVLRFDSKLELLLDFTADKDLVSRTFERDVLFGDGVKSVQQQEPTLRGMLDAKRTGPSYSMEESLLRIAEEIAPMPGPKSVVIVGHGFGRMSGSGVILEPDYDQAKKMLQRARASVFCLDVTDADSHTLEAGLQIVADDTGGFYQRSHVFPEAAMNRVFAALEGQYVLFVEGPQLQPGSHRLQIRLKQRNGVVFAPSNYVTQPAPSKH